MPSQVLRRSKRRKFGSDDAYKTWRNADMDVLWEIFLLLPEEDLFFKISKVCQWWRYVCWEILFWVDYRTIDFSNLRDVLYKGYRPRRKPWSKLDLKGFGRSLEYENRLLHGLNWILGSVAYRDRLNYVTEVVLSYYIYTSDNDLVYIGKRLPNLKKLWLFEAEKVSTYGFMRACRNWKKLEELSIGGLYYEQVIFFTFSLSTNCRNLNSLWLSGFELPFSGGYSLKFDNIISLHIRDLRQLRDLTIRGAGVHKEGVETIMADCEKLSRLNLVNCARLDSGIYRLPAISVEVKRNQTKWCIDAQEELSSIKELIEQLWTF